ncbi:baseplate multidomain protein megatron [Frigidibacter oleivorans]|uniref:baseplate multidomain protein megatron n=1 Tax=Frigidibacter oleivorans TaxID=2487129 RepID=UPI000F8D7C82|nr:glycoside hydrolase/phage tail family protein [Frigidibacter oleivorans]
MATILFAAAGAAVGAGFGGSILGLSSAVMGRAIGATLGRVIDQTLLGQGSGAVETGRVDRFRLTGASEGAPVTQVWGRMRLGGQVIWSGPFVESKDTDEVGGKGAPSSTVTAYSYAVTVAVAICAGRIGGIGRVWADGEEISTDGLTLRVYDGGEDQLPDPAIEAVEGAGMAPAYRGTAYVVFEDLQLAPWGNRVPQFSFEVVRAAEGDAGSVADLTPAPSTLVRGVALMPGTGEYALATTPVRFSTGPGAAVTVNQHMPGERTDLLRSLDQLQAELPACRSVSLIVSWFGDDLRCGACTIRPKVEQKASDGEGYPWRVSGEVRGTAGLVPQQDGRPVYGGTPADRSVAEAIAALKAAGQSVMFYPFLLMEQMAGNALPDPWTGAPGQPALPWRGRITASRAPGVAGSPDRSAQAAAEVAAFFGTAAAGEFAVTGSAADPRVSYQGADGWSYRRFILHYAWLCHAAGGVDAFCIGSEMRGLTQIRGAGDGFPAVSQMRALAREVRAILGPGTKIGYAADWSEYAGYDAGGGDRYFHLDPLWADEEIDFIGIDNYMPLADWRDGADHADAGWGSIHDLGYLRANVEGGEGYDWYYAAEEHRAAQIRTPITDGMGEPWVWRVKDIRGWWENPHHDRIGGVRVDSPSPWVPRSKPVWFTELGCAAIDKGANQPNRFLDALSWESGLPYGSNGRRDDLMQMQYLRAVLAHWDDPARNPLSDVYGGRMIDLGRAHVWAWDARPFPVFPNDQETWADGANWARGHWLTGRAASQPLDLVVAEICAAAGVAAHDCSGLRGVVRGYAVSDGGTGRAALQPLMLAHGFDALERDGALRFRMRAHLRADAEVAVPGLAVDDEAEGVLDLLRGAEAETAGRVRLTFTEAQGAFETRTVEAILPDEGAAAGLSQSELAMALTGAEAQAIAERWLAEARVARDGARLSLPPSLSHLGPGDLLQLAAADGADLGRYRIDRTEAAGRVAVEAVRVEPGVYVASDEAEQRVTATAFVPPVPVFPLFLDLPLLTGEEVPHAPHLAVTATPWPGTVACWSSATDAGYALNTTLAQRAVVGVTETVLPRAAPDLWDQGPALRLRLAAGVLASAEPEAVLNGANVFAIGPGGSAGWEVFQAARAELVAPGVYELSLRLRGQAGSEGDMPGEWPVGSYVVRLDAAAEQIALAASARNLARHYRIGDAQRGYGDGLAVHRVEAFAGIGLRPYAPCHLRWQADGAGGGRLTWVRRTRIGGDSWESVEVPLAEAREAYLVRVLVGGQIRREAEVTAPAFDYGAAVRAEDGATGGLTLEVAQLSETFGPGHFGRIEIDG